MAEVSVYTDPGTYVTEVIAQGNTTLGSVPLAVALVGAGAANRVVTNEAVTRGQVSYTLVVAQTSPYTATLSPASNQALSSTAITLNGTLLPVGGFSYNSPTEIQIAAPYFQAGAVYVISYIAPSSEQDALMNSPVAAIDFVGTYPNVTTFMPAVDYQLTSSEVDWSVLTVATLTGTPTSPFDLSTNYNIAFSLDGGPTLTVDVQGVSPSATTATEVATALNAALTGNVSYGAPYSNAATVSSGHVVLSGIVPGINGSVVLKLASTFSANLEVFGVASSALPLTVTGTGTEPALGSVYYVTYEIVRPNTDYNNPQQFFSAAAAYAFVGYPNIGNDLSNYATICFNNGSPSIFCVLVQPTGGEYTDNDYITGVGATEMSALMTEILPISTSLNVQIATMQSVTNMSSLLQKKRRRGWYGLARNTPIGDIDTPGSIVYLAAATMQVPPSSPGRGRMIVTAPSECSYVITLLSGAQVTLNLNGTALAAATAAVLTGFTSASTALLNLSLAGFSAITALTDAQRKTLASNGVNVVSLIGGVPTLTDPVTTEVAGGGLLEFEEISVMVQKDKVAALVEQQVTANLLGIVPEDLSDFLNDIKQVVGTVLKGEVDNGDIGPYTNPDGTRRDINFQTDIVAMQSPTNKTTFTFQYYFNGRYPAKRFFGQFSVDNPFFAPSQGGVGGA